MEQYSVKLLSHALQDLDSIYTYVAQTLVEPETAQTLIGQLEDAIFSLETSPTAVRNGVMALTPIAVTASFLSKIIPLFSALMKCSGRFWL